jgi:hypothetical protein
VLSQSSATTSSSSVSLSTSLSSSKDRNSNPSSSFSTSSRFAAYSSSRLATNDSGSVTSSVSASASASSSSSSSSSTFVSPSSHSPYHELPFASLEDPETLQRILKVVKYKERKGLCLDALSELFPAMFQQQLKLAPGLRSLILSHPDIQIGPFNGPPPYSHESFAYKGYINGSIPSPSPTSVEELQRRIVEVIKKAGEFGIYRNHLFSAYYALFNEKVPFPFPFRIGAYLKSLQPLLEHQDFALKHSVLKFNKSVNVPVSTRSSSPSRGLSNISSSAYKSHAVTVPPIGSTSSVVPAAPLASLDDPETLEKLVKLVKFRENKGFTMSWLSQYFLEIFQQQLPREHSKVRSLLMSHPDILVSSSSSASSSARDEIFYFKPALNGTVSRLPTSVLSTDDLKKRILEIIKDAGKSGISRSYILAAYQIRFNETLMPFFPRFDKTLDRLRPMIISEGRDKTKPRYFYQENEADLTKIDQTNLGLSSTRSVEGCSPVSTVLLSAAEDESSDLPPQRERQ